MLFRSKAAGLPVVAVSVFGASEMVKHESDGFLTRLNRQEFVHKVSLLVKDDVLRAKMGTQARLNAEIISSRNCALRLAGSYKELLGYEFKDKNNKKSSSGFTS